MHWGHNGSSRHTRACLWPTAAAHNTCSNDACLPACQPALPAAHSTGPEAATPPCFHDCTPPQLKRSGMSRNAQGMTRTTHSASRPPTRLTSGSHTSQQRLCNQTYPTPTTAPQSTTNNKCRQHRSRSTMRNRHQPPLMRARGRPTHPAVNWQRGGQQLHQAYRHNLAHGSHHYPNTSATCQEGTGAKKGAVPSCTPCAGLCPGQAASHHPPLAQQGWGPQRWPRHYVSTGTWHEEIHQTATRHPSQAVRTSVCSHTGLANRGA